MDIVYNISLPVVFYYHMIQNELSGSFLTSNSEAISCGGLFVHSVLVSWLCIHLLRWSRGIMALGCSLDRCGFDPGHGVPFSVELRMLGACLLCAINAR